MTISPGTSVLQGQSLTLTLDCNPKVENPLMECKHKRGKTVKGSKVLSMRNLRVWDSDFWNCTVTLNQKKSSFGMQLSVLGKRLHSLQLLSCSGIPGPPSGLLLVPGSPGGRDGMAPDPSLAEVYPRGPSPLGSAVQQPREYTREKCRKAGGESKGHLLSLTPAFTPTSGQVHRLRNTTANQSRRHLHCISTS